ncbi:MAG: hypothetical protein E7256_16720 [Lachnospiraceae bacterium]|nr:hypothetical protein [Lachnospiraceae bacterium]
MTQIDCLNFCEVLQDFYDKNVPFITTVRDIQKKAGFAKCERIYIGSSFCGPYFLHLSEKIMVEVIEACQAEGISVTLVLPVFTEKCLVLGKEKIKGLSAYFDKGIDEITVNDYGMLNYISGNYSIKLNMGRLFMKDYRDPRYEEYFHSELYPKIFTPYLTELMKKYRITGMEFDPTHSVINFKQKPKDIEIGVHSPYCYMTTGHICEAASIHKEIDHKFRPTTSCQSECKDIIIHYDLHDGRNWYRVGPTIYFENPDCRIEGINRYRWIYFPINEEGVR